MKGTQIIFALSIGLSSTAVLAQTTPSLSNVPCTFSSTLSAQQLQDFSTKLNESKIKEVRSFKEKLDKNESWSLLELKKALDFSGYVFPNDLSNITVQCTFPPANAQVK